MNRFLATTAVALLALAPAAYAQETTAPDPAADTAAPAADTGYVPAVTEGDVFASDLMGLDIYASADEIEATTDPVTADMRAGWEDIGEVSDVLVSEDGQVEAVLVDIGGFLGMGAHTVAVEMDRINLMTDDTGARFAAITATRESLEAAPEFERPEAAPEAGSDTLGAAPDAVGVTPPAADTTATETAPADTMAAGEGAMEPAAEGDMAAEPAAPPAEGEMAAEPAAPPAEGEMAAEPAAPPAEGEMAAEPAAPAAEGDMAAEPAAPADTMAADDFTAPEGYAPLAMEELTAERLEGVTIYGQGDETIGTVSELVLDPSGKVTQAIVDVGGFLGMGAHTVALDFEQLNVVHNAETDEVRVYSDTTKEQLEQMPEYEG